MWRQGNIFLAPVSAIPKQASKRPGGLLVEGELTGHSHRLERLSDGEVLQANDRLYLRIAAPSARIVHQEHGPITLVRGDYLVWQQREYTPEAIRVVRD
ncbi:MAG: hypothetical protein L0Z62_05745 [Gemmataceae bacterium]|nr:hypothetical protein [Gemmataceae bacterium]